jgi:hypothetical protein
MHYISQLLHSTYTLHWVCHAFSMARECVYLYLSIYLSIYHIQLHSLSVSIYYTCSHWFSFILVLCQNYPTWSQWICFGFAVSFFFKFWLIVIPIVPIYSFQFYLCCPFRTDASSSSSELGMETVGNGRENTSTVFIFIFTLRDENENEIYR